MGARMLVVAGLNLDKAWPEEAPGAARGLREASVSLLMEIAQRGIDLGVDALVILGGLWNPVTVRSSTVGDVRAVLGSMPYSVLVVPGEPEAESTFMPQALADWPPTVHWAEPDASSVKVFGDDRFAVVGPRAPAAPPLDEAAALLTTHASPPATHLPVIRSGLPDAFAPAPSTGLTIRPLVPGTGGGHPEGVLLTHDADEGLHAKDITFAQHLGSIRTLPLDEYQDSANLTAALDDLVRQCGRLDRVVVSGRVAPRMLVPPTLAWQPSRDDVTVVWRDLTYSFPTAAADDRTVAAELVRRLSGAGPDAARRHQALALGLSSLQEEAQ